MKGIRIVTEEEFNNSKKDGFTVEGENITLNAGHPIQCGSGKIFCLIEEE